MTSYDICMIICFATPGLAIVALMFDDLMNDIRKDKAYKKSQKREDKHNG